MSVLIKGMEMPKSCKSCDLLQDYDGDMYCPLNNYLNFGDIENVPDYVMIGCPLSAQPEPHWIPRSERLPEPENKGQRRGFYLTTNGYGSVGMTRYEFYDDFQKAGWQCDIRIDAWMPLPEPWRGEEHE